MGKKTPIVDDEHMVCSEINNGSFEVIKFKLADESEVSRQQIIKVSNNNKEVEAISNDGNLVLLESKKDKNVIYICDVSQGKVKYELTDEGIGKELAISLREIRKKEPGKFSPTSNTAINLAKKYMEYGISDSAYKYLYIALENDPEVGKDQIMALEDLKYNKTEWDKLMAYDWAKVDEKIDKIRLRKEKQDEEDRIAKEKYAKLEAERKRLKNEIEKGYPETLVDIYIPKDKTIYHKGFNRPYLIAANYAIIGEADSAFKYLDMLITTDLNKITPDSLISNEAFKTLHSDPRWTPIEKGDWYDEYNRLCAEAEKYSKDSDLEKAMEFFVKAKDLDPKRTEAYSGISYVHYYNGKYEDAMIACKSCLEIDPTQPICLINSSFTNQQLGKMDEAIADFDKLLEADPYNLNTRQERGYLLHINGNTKKARADIEYYLYYNPEDDFVWYLYSGILQAVGIDDYRGAFRAIKKAIALNKNVIEYYSLGANVSVMMKSYWDAAEFYQKMIDIEESAELYFNLGMCRYNYGAEQTEAKYQKNNLIKACAAFNKAAELGWAGADDMADQACKLAEEITTYRSSTQYSSSQSTTCDACSGSGYIQATETCGACRGTGGSSCTRCGGRGYLFRSDGSSEHCRSCSSGHVSCRMCYGSGKKKGNTYCKKCGGDGKL